MTTTTETASTTEHDQGNNETLSTGMTQMPDGQWLALTLTRSQYFKTARGARTWLARRGYRPNGERL